MLPCAHFISPPHSPRAHRLRGAQRSATPAVFASAGHTPLSAVADAAPRGFPARLARVDQREARPAGAAAPPAEQRG